MGDGMKKTYKYMLGIVSAFCIALIWNTYIYMVEVVGNDYLNIDLTDTVLHAFQEGNTITLFIVFSFIFCIIEYRKIDVSSVIYKYRFVIAGVLFVLGIIFEINGSSIGMWCGYLSGDDNNVIWGVSRAIRTDEWAVSTPMLFSQYHNFTGKFPYFSDTIRAGSTDVFFEYGQPVQFIEMIFRPFYLGYLFLPIAKGMAFFWCGRLIALFMVTFEFGMLVTGKNKRLSVVLSFLISFAPVVQWWFAINGLVEMLIFMQLSMVMVWKYMNTENSVQRIPYVVVIMICAGGYILTMYPAWQISLAYVLLGIFVWIIWENYKKFHIKIKDILIIIIAVTSTILILGLTFWKSKETIQLLTNTVYPGSRCETGGGSGENLILYMSNIWQSMFGLSIKSNVCENAMFIDFFPVCYFPAIWYTIKYKTKDKLLIVLSIVSCFLGIYSIIGFPEILAKITLLSNVQSSRAMIAFGMCNILLMIRAMSLIKESFNKIISALAAFILSVCLNKIVFNINPEYYSEKYLWISIMAFAVIFYGILRNAANKKFWSYMCIGLMLISGGLVNPVRSGIDSVTNLREYQAIEKIVNEDKGAKWIVEGEGIPTINFPVMAGAPTINSTNVYPNLAFWKKLDPTGQHEKVYNRYAHIHIFVKQSGKPKYEVGDAPDQVYLYITLKDLRKLGVKYIYSRNDLLTYEDDSCIVVYNSDNYKIYDIGEK